MQYSIWRQTVACITGACMCVHRNYFVLSLCKGDPICRAVSHVGLRLVQLLGLWVWIPSEACIFVFVSVVCCQVEACASGWSLVQRRPTECGVSECDSEISILRPWPTRDTCATEKKDYCTNWLPGYFGDFRLPCFFNIRSSRYFT